MTTGDDGDRCAGGEVIRLGRLRLVNRESYVTWLSERVTESKDDGTAELAAELGCLPARREGARAELQARSRRASEGGDPLEPVARHAPACWADHASRAQLAVFPMRIREANPLPRGWPPKLGAKKAKAWLYPDEDARLLGCVRRRVK